MVVQANGEDTEDSDIDLFIVTNIVEEIEKILQKYQYNRATINHP